MPESSSEGATYTDLTPEASGSIVYTNPYGTQASHEAGTVRRDQWRVSALIWPVGDAQPHRMQRVTDDEADARVQMDGLLDMADQHSVRPCDGHVWWPKLERRTIWESPWQEPVR